MIPEIDKPSRKDILELIFQALCDYTILDPKNWENIVGDSVFSYFDKNRCLSLRVGLDEDCLEHRYKSNKLCIVESSHYAYGASYEIVDVFKKEIALPDSEEILTSEEYLRLLSHMVKLILKSDFAPFVETGVI